VQKIGRMIPMEEDRMTGTSYPAITPTDLSEFQVLCPTDIKTEDEIAKQLDFFDKSTLANRAKINKSQTLQKSLINQIF